MIEQLNHQLDSFDAAQRRRALTMLLALARNDKIKLPKPGTDVNLHSHTFFSYNAYGYSPTHFAVLARQRGLAVAGIVDFDVLDGLEEFLEAGRLIGLKTCASLESRVYVPEFGDRVINSPGEPGIAYHMGVGFTTATLTGYAAEYLAGMRQTATQRNHDLLARVNAFMQPVELDYRNDVLPLTPQGNVTERHICEAYERKAAKMFTDNTALEKFWRDKLGDYPSENGKLQALVRAKTMKRGGVGYVQPGKDSFPLMAEMNRFIIEAGAIPTLTWLDGTSDGEKSIEELFRVAMRSGAAALNIIPDRNYTPGVKDQKLQNLYNVVELAEQLHFPIIVGTEMNAPGNKFVDSFEMAELKPFESVFLKGGHIVYAHSVLQRQSGLGYLSAWARKTFPSVTTRNDFFEQLGSELQPDHEERLRDLPTNVTPARILSRIS